GVVLDLADSGVEGIGVHVVGHLGGVFTDGIDAVHKNLDGGIGGKREGTVWAAFVFLEVFQHFLVAWQLGKVGWQRNQQAFHGWAGDGDEIFVGNALWAHELGSQALLARLAQQQAELGVIATEVDQVGVEGFKLGDDGRVVAVANVDAFEQGDFSTALGEVVANLRRDARAIGLLVVQNGDGLGLEVLDDVVGGKRALLVVAAYGAEEVMRLDGVGNQRRRGPRGNGDDAFLLVHVHGGHRGAGAGVGNGELGAGIDDAVGGRYGLLGFAAVINKQWLELLALDAARIVDGFDGCQRTGLDLVTVLGGRARHGPRDADFDGVCSVRAACDGQGADRKG